MFGIMFNVRNLIQWWQWRNIVMNNFETGISMHLRCSQSRKIDRFIRFNDPRVKEDGTENKEEQASKTKSYGGDYIIS